MPASEAGEIRTLGAMLCALFVVPTCAAAVQLPRLVHEPWRATSYATSDFSGEGTLSRVRSPDFRMTYEPPFGLRTREHFSLRFETCLELSRPRSIGLQLTSDDGARLFVDGALVIDNLQGSKRRTSGRRVALDASVHHIVLEYVQRNEQAVLALHASFDGELPRPLPAHRLRSPRRAGHCP